MVFPVDLCIIFCDGNFISLTHLDIFITGLDNGKPHLGLKYFWNG